MFKERNSIVSTDVVAQRRFEWERPSTTPPRRTLVLGNAEGNRARGRTQAVCWARGHTLGSIPIVSSSVLEAFGAESGDDAILPCDLAPAGKFRHGADRWWCRIHQTYWGTKADVEARARSSRMSCANQSQKLNYVIDPFTLRVEDFVEVGVWCSLPPALSTRPIERRAPKIHLHVRPSLGLDKTIDRDFDAISILYDEPLPPSANGDTTRVDVTPPAALDFLRALEEARELTCINCSRCGTPHLDLGTFAHTPHRKHSCGNCGWDSTWTRHPTISTPLKLLHDQFEGHSGVEQPGRVLNLDEYQGAHYDVWASTPALIWTANRPQQVGIHVHVYDGAQRIVDETYSDVILGGVRLERKKLILAMMDRTVS